MLLGALYFYIQFTWWHAQQQIILRGLCQPWQTQRTKWEDYMRKDMKSIKKVQTRSTLLQNKEE